MAALGIARPVLHEACHDRDHSGRNTTPTFFKGVYVQGRGVVTDEVRDCTVEICIDKMFVFAHCASCFPMDVHSKSFEIYRV